MKRRVLLIAALLCTLAMALPAIAHAESTAGGSLQKNQSENLTMIQFGSYPQTEIVAEESQYGGYDKLWMMEGDCEINASLYAQLQSEDTLWDDKGDTTIDGTKYRRINKSDATNYMSGSSGYYNWSDATTYHYFRYEPIVWRVLSVDESDAFLLAENTLDEQVYHSSYTSDESTTWENCTLRSWLNGYDSGSNSDGSDYSNNNFIQAAFTDEEQSAIETTEVVNADNLDKGTEGGNNTLDKIFLLSESEAYGKQGASYGFASTNAYDTARKSKSSTYAKAMGAWSNIDSKYLGDCWWWLRSPGYNNGDIACVKYGGYVYRGGKYANYDLGVRPALHLNLETSGLWSYKNEVTARDVILSRSDCSYDGNAQTPSVVIEGLTQDEDFEVSYENNVYPGTATITITGAGDWTGTITKNFTISFNAKLSGSIYSTEEGSSASFDQIDIGTDVHPFNGSQVCPTVTIDGLEEDRDFTVTYGSNDKTGVGTITVTGIGKYTGSITKTFAIVDSADLSKMDAELSSTSFIYQGEPCCPTVTIRGLREGENFTVSYEDNESIGEATVTISGINGWAGTITKTFQIQKAPETSATPVQIQKPKGTYIRSLSRYRKAFTVKWKKQQVKTNGYQIRYSRYSSMKSAKIITITKTSTTSKKVKKLKAKKRYYVQVRTYKKVNGKKYYSSWSKKKSVKTK